MVIFLMVNTSHVQHPLSWQFPTNPQSSAELDPGAPEQIPCDSQKHSESQSQTVRHVLGRWTSRFMGVHWAHLG